MLLLLNSKSKMNSNIGIVLPFIAALLMTAQGCQALTQINDFYSARASFELPTNENTSLAFSYQTFNVSLARKYDRSNSPQYAFALADAGALSASISYFDLLVLKTFEASLVLNFIYEPGKWSKASYNYWITFRKDLNLGIESLSAAQITNNNSSFQISYAMRRSAVSNQAAALVFLSGMRFDSTNGTEGHQLSFFIEKQYVNDGKLVFSFITNSILQLSSLSFSFVVFNPQSLSFASYGGVISATDVASVSSKNLKYIVVPSTAYSIYGVSSIQARKPFTLSSQLLNNLTLNYGVNQWEQLELLQITYIIFGQSPANLCLRNTRCQQEGQLLIFGEKCVSSCPPTSKPITHSDGAIECVACPSNMIFSNETKNCVCSRGFTLRSNGVCVAQTLNQLTHSKANAGDMLEDSPSAPASQCLKIVNVQSNNKNLFIKMQAGRQVLQDPQNNNNDYIQLTFKDLEPSSYYCAVNNDDSTQYTCLALFATGIPNSINISATCKLSSNGMPCSSNFSYSKTQ